MLHGGTAILTDINISLEKKFIHEMKANFSDRFYASNMDITKKSSIKSLIKNVINRYGRIDSLVNNAYPRTKNYGKKLEDISYKDFTNMMTMHIGGYFLVSQQFAIFFKSQKLGNIVNMGSVYGSITPRFELYKNTVMTMPVEYATIKSSIIHMTKYFAQYLKKNNIRVNCISPGGVYDNQPKSFISSYQSFCSSKGMLDPLDVANLLIFLLSDSSMFITGQNLIIDDGFSL